MFRAIMQFPSGSIYRLRMRQITLNTGDGLPVQTWAGTLNGRRFVGIRPREMLIRIARIEASA